MDKNRARKEQVIFQNGTVEVHSPGATVRKLPTRQVVDTFQQYSVQGLEREALPDHIKWKVDCGPLTVMILELHPELRMMRWISPDSPQDYGPGSTYGEYKLATPFIVVKVPFLNGILAPRCEVFYRTRELTGLDDDLLWCNLLNVSPESYGCFAWLCTQFLGSELKTLRPRSRQRLGLVKQLHALMTHMWGGGFNMSSEVHEGKSCFTKAREDRIDRRVTDIERWQKASVDNPRFVLDVAWKPVGITVGDLIEKELKCRGKRRDLSQTPELVNVLMAANGGE